MTVKPLWPFVLLIACSSPSPSLWGAPGTNITMGANSFRIYHNQGGSLAEAHRISLEFLPGMSHVSADAYRAIESVTGCKIRAGSIEGDQAVIRAEVDC